MDQVDRVIYDLKNNPFSRRIMTNIYVHQDLHEMNLYPCAYSMTFNVTQTPGNDKLTLNAILNQRSQDILAAFYAWWMGWRVIVLPSVPLVIEPLLFLIFLNAKSMLFSLVIRCIRLWNDFPLQDSSYSLSITSCIS